MLSTSTIDFNNHRLYIIKVRVCIWMHVVWYHCVRKFLPFTLKYFLDCQQAVNPPSIGRMAPLIMALWSLNKNRMGPTTSGSSES